ncbi:NAD(P)-binding domain-containing protein, partial [Escherichia marmotae]|nr:NAD(P)-binding domain-containing protein [Escherichia marmotae]
MATVGLLGTGRMGSAMTRALHAAGHELILWNRSPEAAQRLATELGGTAVERPRDVAAMAGIC